MRAIKPDTFGLDPKTYQDILDAAYATEAQEVARDYGHVTATWEHKPEFKVVVKSDGISREVVTDDPRVGWIDRGTRARIIRGKQKRSRGRFTAGRNQLIFRVGGQPKSQPGMFAAYPGRPGNQWRSQPMVNYPGIKARKWTDHIRERSMRRLWQRTTLAINDATKRRR